MFTVTAHLVFLAKFAEKRQRNGFEAVHRGNLPAISWARKIFAKAMIRFREGMRAVIGMPEESMEMALLSLMEELKVKFQVILSVEREARSIMTSSLMGGLSFFDEGNKLRFSHLHLTGVVQFPSIDQKFLAESNATAKINAQMIQLTNDLVVYDRTKDAVRGSRLFHDL